jgi:hypothetical protein
MRWHLALQQFIFGIHHVKEEDLSRIDLSDLESKSLEYSLESNFDACGSGLFSIYFTEKQEAEAKKLYRVLFLVLQDSNALETLSFDKITMEQVRIYVKHVRLGEDGSTIFVTHVGEDHVLPNFEDRERIIQATHSNGHFLMRPTLETSPRTYWWPNMYKQVQLLDEKCDLWQRYVKQVKSSENGEKIRLHKDRGAQFHLIF